uniref:Uncharacterized protein n=1 Tax=Fibrocapsa japonica TaxID=94617 RepID=A0A7S2V4C0_9STRA
MATIPTYAEANEFGLLEQSPTIDGKVLFVSTDWAHVVHDSAHQTYLLEVLKEFIQSFPDECNYLWIRQVCTSPLHKAKYVIPSVLFRSSSCLIIPRPVNRWHHEPVSDLRGFWQRYSGIIPSLLHATFPLKMFCAFYAFSKIKFSVIDNLGKLMCPAFSDQDFPNPVLHEVLVRHIDDICRHVCEDFESEKKDCEILRKSWGFPLGACTAVQSNFEAPGVTVCCSAHPHNSISLSKVSQWPTPTSPALNRSTKCPGPSRHRPTTRFWTDNGASKWWDVTKKSWQSVKNETKKALHEQWDGPTTQMLSPSPAGQDDFFFGYDDAIDAIDAIMAPSNQIPFGHSNTMRPTKRYDLSISIEDPFDEPQSKCQCM